MAEEQNKYYTVEYIILALLVVFSVAWISLYSFNPYFVQVIHECELYPRAGSNPDPIKCYIYSFMISVLVLVIIAIYIYVKNNHLKNW